MLFIYLRYQLKNKIIIQKKYKSNFNIFVPIYKIVMIKINTLC